MGKYGKVREGSAYTIKGRGNQPSLCNPAQPLATNQRGLYQSGSIEDRLPGTEYSGRELGELASQGNYLGVFAILNEMENRTDNIERTRELALLYGLAAFGLYIEARKAGIDKNDPLYKQIVQPALDYAMQKISGYSPKGESANYMPQKGYSPKGDANYAQQQYLN